MAFLHPVAVLPSQGLTCRTFGSETRKSSSYASSIKNRVEAPSPHLALSQLEQLKLMTTVVADTGDFDQIKKYKPTDSTTNPTLLLQAVNLPQYQHLAKNAVEYATASCDTTDVEFPKLLIDKLAVNFGQEILKIVPGRVSTEVDARLSFDQDATAERARRIVKMYEEIGISPERIYIKIATTWEGILAAKQLEKDSVACNMTLLFGLGQAIAAGEAGVSLVSPFVGRILDWHKAKYNREYTAEEDPGVLSVQRIYNYYKKFGLKTIVMGASFRTVDEVRELAGCDYLTVAPKFLDMLANCFDPLPKKLSAESALNSDDPRVSINERSFITTMEADEMAHDKLVEGIRKFSEDTVTLETHALEIARKMEAETSNMTTTWLPSQVEPDNCIEDDKRANDM